MPQSIKSEIRHKYINGEPIMYKLYYRQTKNTYMQINKNTQLIEVIVSKYSDQSSTNAFIDKYLLKMHEQVSKLANYEMVGPNYEYMYIFAKKYHIRLIKGHKRKSYEIINNCIYFKINKTVDCFDLVKQIYQTQTQGFIKKRFAFWVREMGLVAKLDFKWMSACWGVCHSHEKEIYLATRIGGRSKAAIDYVIVHELAHLQHPNHSPQFWRLVAQYVPEWKKYRKIESI